MEENRHLFRYVSLIILILAAIALFLPVFSGYTVGFFILIYSLSEFLGKKSTKNNQIAKQFYSFLRPISFGVVFFWITLIIASYWSSLDTSPWDFQVARHAIGNSCVKYVMLWFTYLLFIWRFLTSKEYGVVFARTFFLLSIIHLFYCVAQSFTGIDLAHGVGATLGEHRLAYGLFRISGFLAHPLSLGYSLAITSMGCIGLFQRSTNQREKIAWLGSAICSIAVILLSGSRGPQIALYVGLAISIPFHMWKRHILKLCAFIAGLIVIANYYGIFSRYFELMKPGMGGDARMIHWRVYWNIFSDHFWHGIGPGVSKEAISAYYFAVGADDSIKLAHNSILQIGADYGLVGFFGFLVWMSGWFFVIKSAKTLGRSILSIICVMLCGSITQNTFQDSSVMFSLTIWALVLSAKEVEFSEQRSGTANENYVTRKGGQVT